MTIREKDVNKLKKIISGSRSGVQNIWYNEVGKLLTEKNIVKSYCVHEKGFSDDYYIFVDKENKMLVAEHKINNVNTKFMMKFAVENFGCLPNLTEVSSSEIINY